MARGLSHPPRSRFHPRAPDHSCGGTHAWSRRGRSCSYQRPAGSHFLDLDRTLRFGCLGSGWLVDSRADCAARQYRSRGGNHELRRQPAGSFGARHHGIFGGGFALVSPPVSTGCRSPGGGNSFLPTSTRQNPSHSRTGCKFYALSCTGCHVFCDNSWHSPHLMHAELELRHTDDGLSVASPAETKAGLAYWSARALEELDKASEDFAVDPVHDLRVAIRRCRSMADGFLSLDPDPGWRQMKKLGRKLFACLGGLRDTQVMLEWVLKLSAEGDPLRHIVLASLRQREEGLKLIAREAVVNFDRKRWTALNERLAERALRLPLEGPVFQYLAVERWHEAYEMHRTALRNRSGVAWHQLRIGIKRFRYTVENFLPERHQRWSRDLRDLQDALGEVHDFDVLWGMVKSHAEVGWGERALWQQTISEERQKRIELYRKKMLGRESLWQKWRAELPAGEVLARAALEKMRTWAAF